jgi:hypothetical protein
MRFQRGNAALWISMAPVETGVAHIGPKVYDLANIFQSPGRVIVPAPVDLPRDIVVGGGERPQAQSDPIIRSTSMGRFPPKKRQIM